MKHQVQVARQTRRFVPSETEFVGGRVLQVPRPELIDLPPGKTPSLVATHPGGTPERRNIFKALPVRPSKQRGGRRRKAGSLCS